MAQNTTVAISREISEQLKIMAKKKGVSVGVFIGQMVEFFMENDVENTKSDLITVLLRKEVDRMVKLQRNHEKIYFLPTSEKMGVLFEKFADAVSNVVVE